MKINYHTNRRVEFKTLDLKDTFIHSGCLYIKTDHYRHNALNITSASTHKFSDRDVVEPCDVTIDVVGKNVSGRATKILLFLEIVSRTVMATDRMIARLSLAMQKD